MSTQWDAMRDRLISEYGVVGLPEVTTSEFEPDEAPVRRGRPISVKPRLRQPLEPIAEKVTRSDSWWMTVPNREGFTARAEAERQRMSGDVIGRKVPDQIMGKYIGLVRPVE